MYNVVVFFLFSFSFLFGQIRVWHMRSCQGPDEIIGAICAIEGSAYWIALVVSWKTGG